MPIDASACVVGPGTQVVGHIGGDGEVVVEGSVSGTMQLNDHLRVAAGGEVDAQAQVRTATLGGRFAGQLTVAEHLEVSDGAELSGPVVAQTLSLAAGARVHSHLDMPISLPEALH